MRIGIISDTHDNVENVLKAVELFKEKTPGLVLHCGDVVAPKTLTFFKGVTLKMVKGNCDGDIDKSKEILMSIGGIYLGEVGELELGGKKLLMYHGTDHKKLDRFIKGGEYQYVLTGHTHFIRDETIGDTHVLNPGAHYYGADGTVMLLDLAADKVELVKL